MSWAAHDPEGWDDICLRGIRDKIVNIMKEEGIYSPRGTEVEKVLATIRDARQDSNVYEAWICLSLWAHKEVSEHEGSYLESKYGGSDEKY